MSSKVLLINPPFYRLLGSHYNANSLGIAYIASYLNEHGHDAWVYNADYLEEKEYRNLKNLFDGFSDYQKYFSNHDDPIWNEVVEKISDFAPEWVGYTSYTANVTAIDIISRKLKAEKALIKQVIGGVHATLDNSVLNHLPAIDYSVQREGEEAMLSLIEGEKPESISGVVSRNSSGLCDNGDASVIKNIDELPYPERRKFWGIDKKNHHTVDVSYICTIRGCPYRCNYCASPFHWKRDKTQYRSPHSVIQEMKYLKKIFGTKIKNMTTVHLLI